jgi:hypothetical protein
MATTQSQQTANGMMRDTKKSVEEVTVEPEDLMLGVGGEGGVGG